MRNPDNDTSLSDAIGVTAGGENLYLTLAELGQLVSAFPAPQRLFEAVIEMLERRLGASHVMVGEVDPVACLYHRSAPDQIVAGTEALYPPSLSLALAESSFWDGASPLEFDLHDTGMLDPLGQACLRRGIQGLLIVPVFVGGSVRAAVMVRAEHGGFFTSAMKDFLQQAATLIGLGLTSNEQRLRLRQHEREQGRQRRSMLLLNEMIKAVTYSVDEGVLLEKACNVAQSDGGCTFAGIAMAAEESPFRLRLCAATGHPDAELSGKEFALDGPIRVSDAVAAVMRTGTPLLRHAQSGTKPGWPFGTDTPAPCSVLFVPVQVDGRTLGVFVVGASEAAAFDSARVQLFVEMTTELGLGLQLLRAKAARREAERNLRFNLEYFRNIFSNQHIAMLVVSDDDRVKFANEAFCRMHAFVETPAQLEGEPTSLIFDRLTQVYADPVGQVRRIREILVAGAVVKGEEVAVKGGRTYLRDFIPIAVDGGMRGRVWQESDVSEQKFQEQSIKRMAFHDVVTGLPNRRLVFELLEQSRKQAKRDGTMLAVGVLDLDRFKDINDSIGHEGGDQALVEASRRIRGMLRDADVLARFGGDEFALIIPGLDGREQLDAISRCILQALRSPFVLMGEQVHLSASVGWTLYPLDGSGSEGLVRHADLAMYAAKEDGKDRGAIYEPAMEQEQVRLQEMRGKFSDALASSRLRLLFQPIVYIDGLAGRHGVAGMEALLRLDDLEEGMIEPHRFMHVLDDPQLARPIGRFVLHEALMHCQAWLDGGVRLPVSVNISTRHFLHPSFFSDIDAALEAYPGVMDVGFGIEVTETGPRMDHGRAKLVIEECRRRGIRVSLDDFGTGSASLSHIQHLDIEHIKLDQSFVRDILSDERNVAIAAGVITTARMLAKAVIAEGVETAEQGDLLASLGCHQLQGFSISRPMGSDLVAGWVSRWVPPDSWGRMVTERQSLLAGPHGIN